MGQRKKNYPYEPGTDEFWVHLSYDYWKQEQDDDNEEGTLVRRHVIVKFDAKDDNYDDFDTIKKNPFSYQSNEPFLMDLEDGLSTKMNMRDINTDLGDRSALYSLSMRMFDNLLIEDRGYVDDGECPLPDKLDFEMWDENKPDDENDL